MPDPVDPDRPHAPTPFNRADGYSGQDYRPADEAAIGRRPVEPTPTPDLRDLPAEAGHRAGADRRTGEVHGAGAGAGGGQEGEDFDTAGASGESYPVTGGEGGSGRPGNLGPPETPQNRTPLG